MKDKNGFTLLEIMIVIAIVAIISAVAVPGYLTWIPKNRLGSASRDVLSAMQKARLRAIKENTTVAVLFDPDADGNLEGDYVAFVDDGSGGGTAGNWVADGGEQTFVNGQMPEGVQMTASTFNSPNHRTRFNGRGLPGTIGTLTLTNSQSDTRQITLNIVGYSRIQ